MRAVCCACVFSVRLCVCCVRVYVFSVCVCACAKRNRRTSGLQRSTVRYERTGIIMIHFYDIVMQYSVVLLAPYRIDQD